MSDRGHRSSLPLPTSAPTKIQVPVRVAVDFAGTKVRPLAFVWSGRKYVVEKVNLVYKRQQGDRYLWSFAVSDAANSYVLLYDPETLRWTLDEVYTLE
ncbi:MAG: hypothetical protein HY975_00255 [Candidatus Kerfeldbacteria bacterium]|nr:hypothetical protein [Candidatus Kerfeldbacteria bacterium]